MSQDSREKFGVKSQISIGGGRWGEERRERRYVESRTKSRGSIVCVNGVLHYKA